MLGKQTAEMSNAGLDELRDELTKLFPQAGRSTSHWNFQRQEFVSEMSDILVSLPQPNLIERAALKDEQEKVIASLERIQELKTQNANLQKQITVLETLKDKDAVQEMKFKSLPSSQQYNSLLQDVKEELSGFSAIEIRCLYALFTKDWWYPGENIWRDRGKERSTAVKSSWVRRLNDENGCMTDSSHPRYQSAITAIEKLGEYIVEIDKDLKRTIEGKEKYKVNIENIEYWSKAFDEPYLLNMD
jgi:hypothetical protein